MLLYVNKYEKVAQRAISKEVNAKLAMHELTNA